MTADKARKRATRAIAHDQQISYTAAHRQLSGAQSPAGSTLGPAPTPHRAFVLAVTSPKGGTGKTALAVNLAAAAARRLPSASPTAPDRTHGLPRVLVVDASVQQADVSTHLGRHLPTIETLIDADGHLEVGHLDLDTLAEALVIDHELGLAALLPPADRTQANPLVFNGRAYRALVEAARAHFDVIVVDCPTGEWYHDLFRQFILPTADRIAVLVDAQRGSAGNADAWLELVAEDRPGGAGVPRERLGVLVNRAASADDEVPVDVARWPHLGTIADSAAFAAADRSGGVALNAGDPTLVDQLGRVWELLLDRR